MVHADDFQAPVWVEDAETLKSDRVELGRRYARDDMAKHAHKRSQDDKIQEEIWHSVAHLLKTLACRDAPHNKNYIEGES